MERFHTEYSDLMRQAAFGLMNHTATLAEIVEGYSGGHTLQTESGPVDMTTNAAKQLFKKVGLDVRTIKKFNGHPDLQRQMMLARLGETADADQQLIARGVEDFRGQGPRYQMFVPQDRVPVLNSQVLDAMYEVLPETAQLQSRHVSDRKMALRVVDERWTHDLGPGGNALTAIVVENDERGRVGLVLRTGIARVACWNVTLDHQPVFAHAGGFLRTDRLIEAMREAMGRLDEVAGAITNRMNEFHDAEVDDVKDMLRLMSGEVGLPKYVTESAEQWWKDNGSVSTVFWVVQALAFGAQKMTLRKNPQWSRRAVAEYQAFAMADEYVETGTIQLHECPRCHKPLRDYDEPIGAEYEVSED